MKSNSPPARSSAPVGARGAAARPLSFEQEPQDLEDSGPRRRDRWYTTGEMARLSDNTLRTVRFYEEAGILRPVGRTEGGHRLFERPELDRLLLVTDLREAGMSLEEIRTLLDAREKAGSGAEAARTIVASLRRHIENLNRKLEVLTRLHDDLAKTIDTASDVLGCEGHKFSPDTCPACAKLQTSRSLPRAMRVLFPTGGGRSLAAMPAAPAAAAVAGEGRRR
jgi:DNA-binding transcriptional MerR regulator